MVFPLIALTIGVVFLVDSFGISGSDGYYPRALTVAVLAVGAYNVWRGRSEPVAEDGADGGAEGRHGAGVSGGRLAVMAGLFAAVVLLAEPVGFTTAVILLTAGTAVVAGARSPWKIALFTLLLAGAAHLLFVVLLGVALPQGPWG